MVKLAIGALLGVAVAVLVGCSEDSSQSQGDLETAGTSGAGGDDGSVDGGSEADSGLSPTEVLIRASLDVRGTRPTEQELQSVLSDPQSLDAVIGAFVDDAAFGERIKEIFAGAWRTRIDDYPAPGGIYAEAEGSFSAAVGDEPLNLIAYIALNDLPFTEVVTSGDTFVDPLLIGDWPLEEQPADGAILPEGVVRARYTDGRPTAGVLGQNAFYWRHSSTVENANRGRANALSQALLCQSYLDRPIDFPSDLDLTDSESIRDAIQHNGACQACHSTLDPLASYMWGFMYQGDQPRAEYSVGGERAWQLYTDTPPGFFGEPGERLADLGARFASDERFVACAVRRVYEGFLGRKAGLEDEGALAEHREVFLASNLSLKSLVRSILSDPSYRGLDWVPRFGGLPEPVHRKVAPIDVVARSLTQLSGYQLLLDGRLATRLDSGVRTLAGGSDRGSTNNVSTGAVLVQRRLAEAGAIHLVDQAFDGQASGGRLDSLLADVGTSAPSPDLIASLVRTARTKSLGSDDPELLVLADLWLSVERVSGAREAWIALVTAVLADPDHLLY